MAIKEPSSKRSYSVHESKAEEKEKEEGSHLYGYWLISQPSKIMSKNQSSQVSTSRYQSDNVEVYNKSMRWL